MATRLPEARWRALWHALPVGRRPVLRSCTVSAARPERREIDLDVHLRARPGPASTWAASTRVGARILATLGPGVRAQVLVEVSDPADPAGCAAPHPDHPDVTVSVCVRGESTPHAAAEAWSRAHGGWAAGEGEPVGAGSGRYRP